jgi:hypothetical protein
MESTREFLESVFDRVEEVARESVDSLGEDRANQWKKSPDAR